MIQIKEKDRCCGCHACFNSCPQNAIKMCEDEKGFKYPIIDKEKCINCEICEKVCPIITKTKIENKPLAYAAYNKEDLVRCKSSSGGVFSLLAEKILEKNGIVYGAIFDEKFKVIHFGITDKKDLYKIRGSKYVQSEINNIYSSVKQNLEEGKQVLFTGTPCQVEGLKSFLGKEDEKLITQDIICHGVPSPKVWEKYLKAVVDDEIEEISFRNKEKGWYLYSLYFKFKKKSKSKTLKEDEYLQLFLKNQTLRDSCYNCSFKSKNRISDITLADFWGIENIEPELMDEKGVSLVILNSEKGKKIFEEISESIFSKPVDIEKAIRYNESMIKSSIKPQNNLKFWKEFNKNTSFSDLKKKFAKEEKESIIKRILRKVKNIVFKVKR